MQKLVRTLILICVTTAVSACADIKVLYRNADFFAMQAIDANMCPSGKERESVKSTLRKFLRWHQKEELPKYVAVLERVAAEIEKGGMTKATVAGFFAEGEAAWGRMVRKAAGPLSRHMARMTPKQIDCMDANVEKREAEWKEQFEGSDEEYRERWLDRSERGLGFLFGDFDKAQKKQMLKGGPIGQAFEKKMYKHRVKAAKTFADIVRSGNRKAIKKAMLSFATNNRAFYNAEGKALAKQQRTLRLASLERLASILKPQQISYMKRQLRSWAAGFRELASTAQR